MAQALLIIDFQVDFCPGGAHAVPEGDRIAERVVELVDSGRFDLIVATRDWHPADHGSFKERGGRWPVHCVQETKGARFHSALDLDKVDVVISKGMSPDSQGYSAFEETELEQVLYDNEIETVTVVGLATDFGVRSTALGALRLRLDVTVDQAGIRGRAKADSERTLRDLEHEGATIV